MPSLFNDPTADAAFYAACGGLAANLLPILDLRTVKPEERPDLRSILYWLPFVIVPLLGAGLAAAYIQSGVGLQPIVAINVGITAPLILRAMASSPPTLQIPPKSGLPVDPDA